MLMITEKRDADAVTIKLAGTLAGDWATELGRCWRGIVGAPKASRVVVDLLEVSFVDEAGKDVLTLMARAGAEMLAGDILIKSVVEEIARDSSVAMTRESD